MFDSTTKVRILVNVDLGQKADRDLLGGVLRYAALRLPEERIEKLIYALYHSVLSAYQLCKPFWVVRNAPHRRLRGTFSVGAIQIARQPRPRFGIVAVFLAVSPAAFRVKLLGNGTIFADGLSRKAMPTQQPRKPRRKICSLVAP